jgi:hypothetical protein
MWERSFLFSVACDHSLDPDHGWIHGTDVVAQTKLAPRSVPEIAMRFSRACRATKTSTATISAIGSCYQPRLLQSGRSPQGGLSAYYVTHLYLPKDGYAVERAGVLPLPESRSSKDEGKTALSWEEILPLPYPRLDKGFSRGVHQRTT